MSRNQKKEQPMQNTDLHMINNIRSIFIEKQIEFEQMPPEQLQQQSIELQKAVLIYFKVLRPHIKMDLPKYWEEKPLIKTEKGMIKGLKELEQWSLNIDREVIETKDFFGNKKQEEVMNRRKMPIPMILNAAKLLEQAYKELGFAQYTQKRYKHGKVTDKEDQEEKSTEEVIQKTNNILNQIGV